MTNPYHVHIDRRRRPNLTFGRTKEYLSELSRRPPYNSSIHPSAIPLCNYSGNNEQEREERRRGAAELQSGHL